MRRVFDILVSAAALIVTSPLLIAAAIAIVIESPGSPIFKQRRVGKDGVQFELVKLRTMVKNAETIGAGLIVEEHDPRILRSGDFLRRFSIDELPNLVNVLKGEMSIIGPRPTVQSQVDKYDERQRGRLAVKPGITGWAQVNGMRGETDTVEKMSARVKFDIDYLNSWSPWLDLKILLRTVMLVVRDDKAY